MQFIDALWHQEKMLYCSQQCGKLRTISQQEFSKEGKLSLFIGPLKTVSFLVKKAAMMLQNYMCSANF